MADLEPTRRQLHGIAEALIAGPQYRDHQTIRLAVDARGIRGTKLPLAIEGTEFVWPSGRTPLTGTARDVAKIAGVEPGAPEGLYQDSAGLDLDEPLQIDASAARTILDWFEPGDRALRSFAADQEPVLWPEHFDLGITLDEVNYGVSPGDAHEPRPYAYVGPWKPRSGPFWNASFGAKRLIDEVPTVDDLVEFFTEGRRQAAEAGQDPG
jgi:hypothetical protein